MKFANKMKVFDLNIFSKLEEKRAELLRRGMEVINLSVGTPDFRPDDHVIAALKEAAGIADNF